MANGVKTYQISINGLKESITAVDALNESLKALEDRIKALEGKAVNIGSKSSGGGSKSSSTSSLSEEEKLEKQINQLEEKRIAYSKEIYQNYLAAKDVLKETVKDQKSIAASERLAANAYSNTIQGMKQELADIKSAMQTVDLGDTDQLDKMVKRANELNDSLKKIEESYGQFGRNVGNYANGVAEGLSKYKVEIDGVVREFSSAREAAKTLSNELLNLPKGAKGAEELRAALQQVKSEIQDIGKSSTVMDNLLDTMESITAIANVGQGIRGLFGIDDAEIQKSIKNLVALQNILKGIETINKQINTREGIGGWIAPFSNQIDKSTAKLLVFNRALLGTGKSAKVAGVAIKGLSKALKVAFSAGILIVIDLLVEGLMKLVDNFKKVDEEAERVKEVQKDLAEAYGNAQGKLIKYKTAVDNFNGSKKQEKKLIEELNREFGSTLGTYKSLSQWQDVLKKKGDAYIQTLVNQAKAQAALNEVTAAYMNLEDVRQKAANGDYSHWYQSRQQDSEAAARAIEKANDRIAKAEENLKKTIEANDTYAKNNGLGDYANQIEKNGDKAADAAKKAQEDISKKRIDAMKDGLNKTLMQLEEEKRQTINKIRENGVRVQQQVKQVEETYSQLRLKAINTYLENLTKTVDEYSKKIAGIKFQIDAKDIEIQINDIEEEIRAYTEDVAPKINTLTTKLEYEAEAKGLDKKDLAFANLFNYKNARTETEAQIKEYYKWLDDYVSTLSEDLRNKLSYKNLETGELKTNYDAVEDYIKKHYERELNIINSYGLQANASLKSSMEFRLSALDDYNEEYINKINAALDEEMRIRISAVTEAEKVSYDNNDNEFKEESNALNNRLFEIKSALEAIENVKEKSDKKMSDEFYKNNEKEIKELQRANGIKIETYKQYYDALKNSLVKQEKETNKQIEDLGIIHANKMQQIAENSRQEIIQIENDIDKKRTANTQRYYDSQLSNYRDFLSKINEEASKQPVLDTAGFGIVNVVQTKRNYKEVLEASNTMFQKIKGEKTKLSNDFAMGLISTEAYNAILNQLNDLSEEVKRTVQAILDNLKNVNSEFLQSIQVYLNAALDSFNTIMQAVWTMEDNEYDDEQERLDKENEMIKEKLDEQADIINEYKNKVESIEDELANSRGDRRQHLIDQLNAEIEAERRAQKEKESLEKQEEANKKKQEKLERDRKKSQYNRDKLQAIVNGALAVTYAAMNTWPIPAVPLMALAASTTAAQLAIMSANKPYKHGGVLEGPSHAQGGIKVYGGYAEVEGHEYIVNKATTIQNEPLLDFINSKKKRIDLSDMIDFYSSGSVKKNIANVRTKFEDGGYLPTLPNYLDVKDQLQNIIINQDNRPIYVSVVDINNKQEEVRKVQTLAGL